MEPKVKSAQVKMVDAFPIQNGKKQGEGLLLCFVLQSGRSKKIMKNWN
jgi:hypothetical protein